MNKKRLNEFISLKDLPPIEEHIGADYFLKIYHAILIKGGGRELMAKYIGRKPMSVKKKLKSIIKEYNSRHIWQKNSFVQVKDIKDLEEKLLEGFFDECR